MVEHLDADPREARGAARRSPPSSRRCSPTVRNGRGAVARATMEQVRAHIGVATVAVNRRGELGRRRDSSRSPCCRGSRLRAVAAADRKPIVMAARGAVRRRRCAPRARRRARAGSDVARTQLDEALAAARRAQTARPTISASPASCRTSSSSPIRAPRAEQYAAAKGSAREKTLAARALLPERCSEARLLLMQACDQDPAFGWCALRVACGRERRSGRNDRALAEAARGECSSIRRCSRRCASTPTLAGSTGAREAGAVGAARGWSRRPAARPARSGACYADLLLSSRDGKRDAAAAGVELRAMVAADRLKAAAAGTSARCFEDVSGLRRDRRRHATR